MAKRELLSSKAITAVIERACELCGKTIKKGEVCRRAVVFIQDGEKKDVSTTYECWECWGKNEEYPL